MRAVVLTLLGIFSSTVLSVPQGHQGHYYGPPKLGDDKSLPTPTPRPSPTPAPTALNTTLIGMNGDAVCTPLMCIGALVDGSNVRYTLQSLGSAQLGWMAMGFGQSMANSPMVIMWPNSDGTITLSQRQTSGHVMPTVVPNPPRIATLQAPLSDLAGSNPKLVYTIPANGGAQQNIIWAFSSVNPDDPATDATIVQHRSSGPLQLNLGNTLAANSRDPTNPAGSLAGPGSPTNGGASTPLLPYQKKIVAHAILLTVGFLGILPAGALLARYLRTFNPVWFKGHQFLQLVLSFPIIVTGFSLGIAAVAEAGATHLSDDHMRWGVAIFVLYVMQLVLGEVIHRFKPKSWAVGKRRPPQNYLHAIFGLLIIGLAFYQVRSGFRTEWPKQTGRGNISNAANIVWILWVVLLPVLYIAGLAFLPRQFRQEQMPRAKSVPGTGAEYIPVQDHSTSSGH